MTSDAERTTRLRMSCSKAEVTIEHALGIGSSLRTCRRFARHRFVASRDIGSSRRARHRLVGSSLSRSAFGSSLRARHRLVASPSASVRSFALGVNSSRSASVLASRSGIGSSLRARHRFSLRAPHRFVASRSASVLASRAASNRRSAPVLASRSALVRLRAASTRRFALGSYDVVYTARARRVPGNSPHARARDRHVSAIVALQ